jgi:hypothetical protein
MSSRLAKALVAVQLAGLVAGCGSSEPSPNHDGGAVNDRADAAQNTKDSAPADTIANASDAADGGGCGSLGGACCADGSCNDPTLACRFGIFGPSSGTCNPCGGNGQVCCGLYSAHEQSCSSGFNCNGQGDIPGHCDPVPPSGDGGDDRPDVPAEGDTETSPTLKPHGCTPGLGTPECGGVGTTCTAAHGCCLGVGSDCGTILPYPGAGVVVRDVPCSTDEMCEASEYCQAATRCCPVAYTCNLILDGGAKDGLTGS